MKNLKKLIALSILFSFLATNFGYAIDFEAPRQFCLLQKVYSATNASADPSSGGHGPSDVFIIPIQDAHANVSGQKNLAKTLDALMNEYKVSLVLSEGGAGDCSLSELKKLAPAKTWKRIAKKYLLQGKLKGEEYLNLTSDHPMKIIGVEDMDLYSESVGYYAELKAKRQENVTYLQELRHAVDKLKRKLYPSEISQSAARDLLRNDKGSGVISSEARDLDVKLVHVLDQYLEVLLKGYSLQMNSEEFASFKINEADFPTREYVDFINRKLLELGYTDRVAYKSILDDSRESLVKFYELAEERDVAFMENANRILALQSAGPAAIATPNHPRLHPQPSGIWRPRLRRHPQIAVLIAGGYHTAHLEELFQEKGYSYAVLTPLVTRETNHEKYEKRLLGDALRELLAAMTGFEGLIKEAGISKVNFQAFPNFQPARGARLAVWENERIEWLTGEEKAILQKTNDLLLEAMSKLKLEALRQSDYQDDSRGKKLSIDEVRVRLSKLQRFTFAALNTQYRLTYENPSHEQVFRNDLSELFGFVLNDIQKYEAALVWHGSFPGTQPVLDARNESYGIDYDQLRAFTIALRVAAEKMAEFDKDFLKDERLAPNPLLTAIARTRQTGGVKSKILRIGSATGSESGKIIKFPQRKRRDPNAGARLSAQRLFDIYNLLPGAFTPTPQDFERQILLDLRAGLKILLSKEKTTHILVVPTVGADGRILFGREEQQAIARDSELLNSTKSMDLRIVFSERNDAAGIRESLLPLGSVPNSVVTVIGSPDLVAAARELNTQFVSFNRKPGQLFQVPPITLWLAPAIIAGRTAHRGSGEANFLENVVGYSKFASMGSSARDYQAATHRPNEWTGDSSIYSSLAIDLLPLSALQIDWLRQALTETIATFA